MGYLRMRRDLSAPIAPAPFPDGVVLDDFNFEIARSCRDLMNTVYAEGMGDVVPFDAWFQALESDSEYDPSLCFVAVGAGKVLGFCHGWRIPFIKDLVVAPAWRGRGLGRALVTLALETFKARGAASVDLKTDIDNEKAQSLYRRLGFVIVERVD